MRRLPLIILLVLGSVGAGFSALLDDAALSKPVTLAAKGEALGDIMLMLQEQTGMRLRTSVDTADQKATIFVDKKPLREVMEGLATLLKYQWTSKVFEGRQTYELFEDEKTRRDREARWQKARAKAWEAALAEMKLKDRFGHMTKEERDSYRIKLMTDMSKGVANDGLAQLDALTAVEYDPLVGPVARFVLSSPQTLKAIQDGMAVYYDLESPEPEWKLSTSLARTILERKRRAENPSSRTSGLEPERIGLRVSGSESPKAIDLQFSGNLRYRPDPQNSISSDYVGWLAYQRISSHLEAPKDYLPLSPGDALGQKVSLGIADFGKDVTVRPKDDSSGSAWLNRSNVLEALRKKLGLQIISDHYSYWYLWSLPKESTVKGILDGFKNQVGPAGFYAYEAAWGWDGKYLCARTKDVKYSDATEVPNRLLRPWQQAYSKNGSLGLDELGQIAQLSEEQIETLKSNSVRFALGERIPVGEGLRLYGMLSPDQREQARGTGVSVSELTVTQREVLDRLMQNRGAPAVRVGIYKGDRRVDKPMQLPEEQATTLLIREKHLVLKSRTPTGATMESSFALM